VEWHRSNQVRSKVHGQNPANPWSFKFVDKQPDNVLEKQLKVFPVTELVTYGFPRNANASITNGGASAALRPNLRAASSSFLEPPAPTICTRTAHTGAAGDHGIAKM
jgi:hypothetical protein